MCLTSPLHTRDQCPSCQSWTNTSSGRPCDRSHPQPGSCSLLFPSPLVINSVLCNSSFVPEVGKGWRLLWHGRSRRHGYPRGKWAMFYNQKPGFLISRPTCVCWFVLSHAFHRNMTNAKWSSGTAHGAFIFVCARYGLLCPENGTTQVEPEMRKQEIEFNPAVIWDTQPDECCCLPRVTDILSPLKNHCAQPKSQPVFFIC